LKSQKQNGQLEFKMKCHTQRGALPLLLASLLICGCGVKGDPTPPGRAPELGRGKPNYKRATESLAFPLVPPVLDESQEEDGEKSESGSEY
jgi:hypothetical protein